MRVLANDKWVIVGGEHQRFGTNIVAVPQRHCYFRVVFEVDRDLLIRADYTSHNDADSSTKSIAPSGVRWRPSVSLSSYRWYRVVGLRGAVKGA
jgi:hypothetical protein